MDTFLWVCSKKIFVFDFIIITVVSIFIKNAFVVVMV